jgi:hypothetical protein
MTACSICGHRDCGHTDEERKRAAWLESRIIHVSPIQVDAAKFQVIRDSYSGDTLDPDGPTAKSRIRKPFEHAGEVWIAVSSSGNSCECYRVVLRIAFKEKVRHIDDYGDCTEDEQDELWRYAPKGFYHGIAAWRGGTEIVLVGPETEFVCVEK